AGLAGAALPGGGIRAIPDLPGIAQMAFTDEGGTVMGRPPAEVARTLRALGAQALGANCSVGSSTLYDVLERMVPEAGGLPLAIQPNAGLPSRIGERLIYLSSPADAGRQAGVGVGGDRKSARLNSGPGSRPYEVDGLITNHPSI